jgi:cell division protein FtsB
VRGRPLAGGLALAVLVSGLAIWGGTGLARVWRLQREMQTLERDLVTLRSRTQELSQTVERLRHDPAFIEKIAREELGWVRPGDTVLKLPSPSPPR